MPAQEVMIVETPSRMQARLMGVEGPPPVRIQPHATRALFVSEDFVRRNRWAGWARAAGFDVATCCGPGQDAPCPKMDGRMCPLREWADVALVEVPAPSATGLTGQSTVCRTLPDDRRTVVVRRIGKHLQFPEGRSLPIRPYEPATILEAIRVGARRI